MGYRAIIYEKRDGIGYITLNRPQVYNAVNPQMAIEVSEACQAINEDDEVRVAIITGAGDRAFSSGGDIKASFSIAEKGGEPRSAMLKETYPRGLVSKAVADLRCPTIAAVNGIALGQGLEIALACDIRIASEKAQFGFPNTARGLIPGGGGTQRLPRIVGRGKALEMLFTADPIDAEEAYRWGLVNMVVPPEKLMPSARNLAERIIARAAIAVNYAKEAVHKGLDMSLEQGLRLEADLSMLLQTTEDRAEGISSFLEKRTPQFKGK